MTADQRLRAARAFWADEEATDDQVQAVLLIAQQKKFRPKTVIGLDSIARRSIWPASATLPDALAARALDHLSPRRAAADDGRVSRRARHRARERADSGRQRQAGRREDRRRPSTQIVDASSRRRTCRSTSTRCSARIRKRGARCEKRSRGSHGRGHRIANQVAAKPSTALHAEAELSARRHARRACRSARAASIQNSAPSGAVPPVVRRLR